MPAQTAQKGITSNSQSISAHSSRRPSTDSAAQGGKHTAQDGVSNKLQSVSAHSSLRSSTESAAQGGNKVLVLKVEVRRLHTVLQTVCAALPHVMSPSEYFAALVTPEVGYQCFCCSRYLGEVTPKTVCCYYQRKSVLDRVFKKHFVRFGNLNCCG